MIFKQVMLSLSSTFKKLHSIIAKIKPAWETTIHVVVVSTDPDNPPNE